MMATALLIACLVLVHSPLLQCKAAVTGVQKMSDTDKAYFMADYLVKHEGVSHYVYESLMAFKELVAFISNHTQTNSSEPMDPKTSQQIEEFAIVHFPDLIRHSLFKGASLVLTQEFGEAFAKTFPSPKEGMKEFQNNSSVTLNKVLSSVDVPVTLTKLLFTFEKPIETMRHEKNSTLYIERLRNAILLLLSPTVQQVLDLPFATILDEDFSQHPILVKTFLLWTIEFQTALRRTYAGDFIPFRVIEDDVLSALGDILVHVDFSDTFLHLPLALKNLVDASYSENVSPGYVSPLETG